MAWTVRGAAQLQGMVRGRTAAARGVALRAGRSKPAGIVGPVTRIARAAVARPVLLPLAVGGVVRDVVAGIAALCRAAPQIGAVAGDAVLERIGIAWTVRDAAQILRVARRRAATDIRGIAGIDHTTGIRGAATGIQ